MTQRARIQTGALILALTLTLGTPGVSRAQTAPALTATQIMDRYIAATGGADAYAKITSSVQKATMSIMPQQITGTMTITSKAPSKFLAVTNFTQVGESREGYDGKAAWSQDVISGARLLSGTELADVERQAKLSNSPTQWKTLYKSVEAIGTKKIGDAEAYGVKMTPAVGAPVTQYFDTKTFLMLEEDSVEEGPTGTVPVVSTFSDYRAMDGVKTPFTMVQSLASGISTVTTKITDVKNNVPVDDTIFAPPAGAVAPAAPAPAAPAATPGDASKT